ncbi:unnamed protein product [Fraxinus pennsylvanica]|uniref:ATPase AAA-type core domain-containing protein n=1 Tax=Fraxinus pennsylvanica TaxID=56036 RepID=A0AAD2A9V7_9LAMI|nr:unnamed protein product [Fraxinus pennsylvanica]
MVRELFQMARSKKACIVVFDEIDAIGGARFDDGVDGDNEVQRTMLEIVNQIDGIELWELKKGRLCNNYKAGVLLEKLVCLIGNDVSLAGNKGVPFGNICQICQSPVTSQLLAPAATTNH